MRHALYCKELGFPLIFRSRSEATRAQAAMPDWPTMQVYPVYHYTHRESPMLPDSRSSGVGGVFKDSQDRCIVLGSPVERS